MNANNPGTIISAGYDDLNISGTSGELVPSGRQVICLDNGQCAVQVKDKVGTFRSLITPAGDIFDGSTGEVAGVAPISDGVSVQIYNTNAGAQTCRYYYIKYG